MAERIAAVASAPGFAAKSVMGKSCCGKTGGMILARIVPTSDQPRIVPVPGWEEASRVISIPASMNGPTPLRSFSTTGSLM